LCVLYEVVLAPEARHAAMMTPGRGVTTTLGKIQTQVVYESWAALRLWSRPSTYGFLLMFPG
jgi:hypothetical protein